MRYTIDHTDRVIAALGVVMMAAYLTATIAWPKPYGRVVFGDATHHFVQLRSIVFDHDVSFQNEYLRIYRLTKYEPETNWIFYDLTPTGHVRNYMPLGPAILWAPLYLLAAGIQLGLSYAGLAARPDGYEWVLQLVPGVTGIIAAALAAWISWRLARRLTDEVSAAIGTLAVWLGSSAIYYSVISPSYSHTASMLACSLFVSHWLGSRGEWRPSRAAASGALAGVAALMRWQDAMLLAIPVFEALRSVPSATASASTQVSASFGEKWRYRVGGAVAACAAAGLVFSPQMMVWRSVYGRWLAMPQGPSFVRWTDPHPFLVLFSDRHGLFSWTPIVVLCLWGLVNFVRRHPRTTLPIAFLVLGSWYVNASVVDWWAGEAFGARRFLSLFPLLVLGLAAWVQPVAAKRARWMAVGTFLVLNWLLLLQYELFMKGFRTLTPYPSGGVNLWLARFVVPFRAIARWFS